MNRRHVTALAIALAVLIVLLSGCVTMPREQLASYQRCIANVAEYGFSEQFNAAYCKRETLDGGM